MLGTKTTQSAIPIGTLNKSEGNGTLNSWPVHSWLKYFGISLPGIIIFNFFGSVPLCPWNIQSITFRTWKERERERERERDLKHVINALNIVNQFEAVEKQELQIGVIWPKLIKLQFWQSLQGGTIVCNYGINSWRNIFQWLKPLATLQIESSKIRELRHAFRKGNKIIST